MQPQPVVKHLDVFKDFLPRLASGLIASFRGQFLLECRKEALRDSVVPAILHAAHARHDAVLLQQCAVFLCGVNPTAVGVVGRDSRLRRSVSWSRSSRPLQKG